MSSWSILGAYLTRYDISVKLRICIRNVLFRDLSISVKYLTQNRPNGKICCNYILYENLWWYATDIAIILLEIGFEYNPIYCNRSYSYSVYDKDMNTTSIFDKIWMMLTKSEICIRNALYLGSDICRYDQRSFMEPIHDNIKLLLVSMKTIYCLHDVYWVHILTKYGAYQQN